MVSLAQAAAIFFDSSSSIPLTWLILDQFITADAAPVTTPRACEPTGTLTLTQVGTEMSIASAKLIIGSGATEAGTKAYDATGIATAVGQTFYASISTDTSKESRYGLANTSLDQIANDAASFRFRSVDIYAYPGGVKVDATKITNGAQYDIWIVSRSNGAWLFIHNPDSLDASGRFANPTCFWMAPNTLDTTLHLMYKPGVTLIGGDGHNILEMGVTASGVGAPFDTADGYADTSLDGAVAEATNFTHQDDFLLHFTVGTLPSAGVVEVGVRMADKTAASEDGITIAVNATGGLELFEYTAGTPTSRGTSAAVISAGERVTAICSGTSITVYDEALNRITYASLAYGTGTAGYVKSLGTGGVITRTTQSLETCPRTPSGTALTQLEAIRTAARAT